ncbi:MAG: alpha/beta hydrolase [Acidobacteriota bacterium]|nr:alpha/beta hydrolase [Acidobacteriota bacterium]
MVDVGSGPPVILIPGVQGRWEWMQPAVEALAKRCRVITFSLAGDRGSGRRFDPAWGFENYMDQIDDVMTTARLSDAAICGVSFGGLIALHWAIHRSPRTRALVLVSTPPPDFKPNRRLQWYMRAPRLLSVAFAAQSPFRLCPEMWPPFDRVGDRLGFAAKHLARVTTAPFSPPRMAERGALLATADFDAACNKVVAPTLVVTGETHLDRIVPVAGTKAYASRIQGARHETLERTGHLGLVTRPGRFAELVGAFVWQHAATVATERRSA